MSARVNVELDDHAYVTNFVAYVCAHNRGHVYNRDYDRESDYVGENELECENEIFSLECENGNGSGNGNTISLFENDTVYALLHVRVHGNSIQEGKLLTVRKLHQPLARCDYSEFVPAPFCWFVSPCS